MRRIVGILCLLGVLCPHMSFGFEVTVKRTVAMMPTNSTDKDYLKFHGAVGEINTVNNEITNDVYMKSDNADSLENTIDKPVLHKIYKMIGRHKALYISGVEDVPMLNKHKVFTKNAIVQSEYSIELLSQTSQTATLRLAIHDQVMSGSNRSGFVNIKSRNNSLLQAPVVARAAEQVNIEKLPKGQEFVYYVLPKIEEEASGIQRMVFYQISVK